MSEYKKLKDRAQAVQREKEEELKRELAAKAEKDKQLARDEEEKWKRREAQAKEARRLELVRANEELIRRSQAAMNGGSNGRLEYDPFAEDERPTPSSTPTTTKTASPAARPQVKLASNGHTNGPRQNARPGPSKLSGSTSRDRNSPPPLGRKERAAKAFAHNARKSTVGDSVFSVRALVESRNGSSSPAPSASATPRYIAPVKPVMSTKDRMKKQAAVDGLRKLCPDRSTRDRRTIDQIHKDIKARKGGDEVPVRRSRSRSPLKHSRSVSPLKPKAKPKPPPIPTTARPAPPPRINNTVRPASHTSPPKRRRASSSPSTSSSSDSPPMRNKRPRSRSPGLSASNQAAISAEIQALFRRPGRPEPRRYADSDASSDMEAGMSDVEAEERRTARIARLEDEKAEREERERKLAKEKAKKERMKGRA